MQIVAMDNTERLSAAEVKAIAGRAHCDDALRERLFDDMINGEGRVARNAAWVLTHLHKNDNCYIDAHRDALVAKALSVDDDSLRRLTLALLERLEWRREDIRTDLLDFCLSHLVDPNETYGVRALCIKLASVQCRYYDELRAELHQTLLLLDPATLNPGIKHTWGKALKATSQSAS